MYRSNDSECFKPEGFKIALRRWVLAAGLALSGLAPAAAADLVPPAAGVLDFNIIRKGDVIGHYHSDFTLRADHALEVRTHVAVAVTMGPIRLYAFDHNSTETWRGGRLIGLIADTDDDGDVHHLRAEGRDEALSLTVDGKTTMTSGDAVPSSLWSRDMLDGNRPIFDIGDGQLFHTVTHCDAAPRPVVVCEISGELTRILRYDSSGLLAGLTFPADDGSKVTYLPN
jgi:hypothetical protein